MYSPIIVNDPYPYSEIVFENSPINRVLEQGAPGQDWQPSSSGGGHTVKIDYDVNTSANVRLFTVVNGQLQNEGFYSANQLYKTVTCDENWQELDATKGISAENEKLHTTEEYKDKLGQVVLKRSFVDTSSTAGVVQIAAVETYYVYDDYGLLRFVVPPEAVKEMFDPSHEAPSVFKLVSEAETLEAAEEGINGYLVSKGGSLTLKPGYIFTATADKSLSVACGHVSADLIYSYLYDDNQR